MEQVPLLLDLAFVAVSALSVRMFYVAAARSLRVLSIIMLWLLFQGLLGYSGFYTNTSTMPPRLLLLLAPPLALIASLFISHSGRRFLDTLDAGKLTLLHSIRIGVELILLGLATYGVVPQLMTFEGLNWDILGGLSAPLVWFFGLRRRALSSGIVLAWNIICLGLLINIVCIALLSTPTSLQKLAFDRPNIAIFRFPYVWLPACVVPLVLLSHLANIRRLILNSSTESNINITPGALRQATQGGKEKV